MNPVGATVSFFRYGEIYRSDAGRNNSGERPKDRPPAHRSDESPAGYSSASCSPAELASASPAELHAGELLFLSATGQVTLLHSVVRLARVALVVADFKGIRDG